MDTRWGRHSADEERSPRPTSLSSGPSSVPPHHVVRNGDVGRDISVRCQRCVGEKPRWRARGDLIVFPRILSLSPSSGSSTQSKSTSCCRRRRRRIKNSPRGGPRVCQFKGIHSPVTFGREKETSRLNKYREFRAQSAGDRPIKPSRRRDNEVDFVNVVCRCENHSLVPRKAE